MDFVQCPHRQWKDLNLYCYYSSLSYSAIFCSWADSLRTCHMWFWMSDRVLSVVHTFKFPRKWCTDRALWLLHGWCHVKLLPSQHKFWVPTVWSLAHKLLVDPDTVTMWRTANAVNSLQNECTQATQQHSPLPEFSITHSIRIHNIMIWSPKAPCCQTLRRKGLIPYVNYLIFAKNCCSSVKCSRREPWWAVWVRWQGTLH